MDSHLEKLLEGIFLTKYLFLTIKKDIESLEVAYMLLFCLIVGK